MRRWLFIPILLGISLVAGGMVGWISAAEPLATLHASSDSTSDRPTAHSDEGSPLLAGVQTGHPQRGSQPQQQTTAAPKPHSKETPLPSTPLSAKAAAEAKAAGVTYRIDPYQPSGGPYPDLSKIDPQTLWVDVDLSTQRVILFSGKQRLYTMVTSSGIPGNPKTATPTGTFYLQNRGTWFYNDAEEEGAMYWTSFLNWGEFLFHSVAMDEQHRVLPREAAKLGQPASHGCLRLTVADARWFYTHLPAHTKVVIHN
ncbi:MAG: L,D-transpeptidase family protein [Firmicutes bacterium]|nr:L,D-transpeptidase family protein [Bacillota bacterium]